jgi:hypothetical protein
MTGYNLSDKKRSVRYCLSSIATQVELALLDLNEGDLDKIECRLSFVAEFHDLAKRLLVDIDLESRKNSKDSHVSSSAG